MSGKGDGGVGARSVVGVRLVLVVCDYGLVLVVWVKVRPVLVVWVMVRSASSVSVRLV